MNSGPSGYVIVGAVAYLLVLIVVGFYTSRNIRSSADFIVAGRTLPLWLCTATVFATWFGSGTLVGAAGAAYNRGISGVLSNPIGSAVCLLLAGMFYVRVLRRMRLLTVPDLFRTRFGMPAEVLSSVCIIPAYVGWVGSIFVAFGFVLQTIAGVDTTTAILIGAAVTLVYTFAGGMWAVSLTDFFQALVIATGLLVLYPLVLGEVGGLSGLLTRAPAGHFTILPGSTLKEWLWFVQAVMVIGVGNIASQDLMQRAFGARTESVAQWSMYLAAVVYMTIAMLPVLFGIAGKVLLPDIADPELVLPSLGMAYLHPFAMALFTGAMFSALMSSADGGLLAPASIFSENILRVARPDLTDRQLLWATRGAIVVVGMAGLMTALFFQNVYELMVKSFSILFVGLIIPMTAAIYWQRCNGPAAVASLVTGMVGWLTFEWLGTTYPPDLMAAAIGLVTLVVVTLTTSNRVAPLPLADIDGQQIAYRDRLGTLAFPRLGASE